MSQYLKWTDREFEVSFSAALYYHHATANDGPVQNRER